MTPLDVKELITFIRTPTWITAGFAQSKAGPGGSNFKCESLSCIRYFLINMCSVSQEQKDEFRNDPAKYIKYRKEVESELNRRFKLVNSLIEP